MKKVAVVTLAALTLVMGAVTLLGQSPVVQKLASGTYTVYAASPQIWRVFVDPKTMGNATITGHFSVTDGTPKTIDVLVFDEANYMHWKNEDAGRNAPKPLGSMIQTAQGDISAAVTEPGYHYLVISDRHEYEGHKVVNADIKLQYDKH